MIRFVSGDLFATPSLTVIAHGVNLRGAFGAGVAGEIARRLPWAHGGYDEWLASGQRARGDVEISVGPDGLCVAHLATQSLPGPCARLDAIEDACGLLVHLTAPDDVIGMPQIGCGIGGLRWESVKPILSRVFFATPQRVLVFETYIYGRDGAA